jgi:hypothetical protein
MTAEARRAVVQDIIALARDKYVYPDTGEETARHLQTRLDQGAYDRFTDAPELALSLTFDLRDVSADGHWSVLYDPQGAAEHVDPEEEQDGARWARWLASARRRNFGFARVERLRGNVGYIDLREFAPSEVAGETAVHAMAFVGHCDALIFDLRLNHGGHPSMVQLLTSYLVEAAPQHINTFYYRPSGEYQQFWTFPHVPGQRRPEVPVYVLTSQATGSAAEEFAYNLRHMGRATLVGETTIGAAHPVSKEVVQGQFQVRLPYGRPINPITGSNWEGAGVEPHLAVPQAGALKTAHLHALERVAADYSDEQQRRGLDWEREIVASLYEAPIVDQAVLTRYAGHYGQRSFSVEAGCLVYAHAQIPVAWRLTPMSDRRFRLDEDLKFEFRLDEEGTATAVSISYRDGRPEVTVGRTA